MCRNIAAGVFAAIQGRYWWVWRRRKKWWTLGEIYEGKVLKAYDDLDLGYERKSKS